MDPLDKLLKTCIQEKDNDSPPRRPSIFGISSKQSTTPTLITQIEETFDSLIQTITDLPSTIETKFDSLIQTVTEIPSTIEETFDDLIDSINEFVSHFNSR